MLSGAPDGSSIDLAGTSSGTLHGDPLEQADWVEWSRLQSRLPWFDSGGAVKILCAAE